MRCPATPLVDAALWILQGLLLTWELIDRHTETGSWRGGYEQAKAFPDSTL